MSNFKDIVINHFGMLLPIDKISEKILNKECIFIPKNQSGYGENIPIQMYRKYERYIALPVYLGAKILNIQDIQQVTIQFPKYNKLCFGEDNITLREHQKKPFDIIKKMLDKNIDGGILHLATGSGKTVLSLKVIHFFKMKTLIIVNKIELMNQWIKAIEQFLPTSKIGKIQGPVFDIQDKDIVIGMLQTLSKKYNANHFKSFGLCIIDEVHNTPSQIFSNIAFKIRPKYLLGLSATVKRKDEMHVIIHDYIGPILYSDSASHEKQNTLIKIIPYKGESSVEKYIYDGSPAVSSMISCLANDFQRTEIIIREINTLLENENRNILVISDRTSQLKYLYKKLGSDISGLFIGSLKSEELEKSKEKRVLLGTYGLTNEGFNLPKLNSLIFATPRSSITQAIGRIFRKTHDIQPIIIDIYDTFSIFKYQGIKRKKLYKEVIKNVVFENNSSQENDREITCEKILFLD
jgi:superfamily II DNA or RNA helicase